MATSLLRPSSGMFSEQDLIDATLPKDSDVLRGIASTGANMSAMFGADEALRAEAAGSPGYSVLRDRAVASARRAEMTAPRVRTLEGADTGDAIDFIQGGAPGALMTSLPSIAGAVATRGRLRGALGGAAGFGGAAVPAYWMERGETALGQYTDPELSKASVQDRDAAATQKAVGAAALEAIVPAGLAGSILRKPTTSFLGTVGRNSTTEAATEVGQTYLGQLADQQLDPARETNPWGLVDAGVLGAAGGAGMSALGVGAGGGQQQAPAPTPARAAPEAPKNEARPEPVPVGGSDFIGDTIARMKAAAGNVGNPVDYVRQVFGSRPEDLAAADALPDAQSPEVLTAADPEAAMVARDAQRAERAAGFAAELMNSAATPEFVKQKIAGFGGDFTSPEAADYVRNTFVGQRAGEKVGAAIMDFVDSIGSVPAADPASKKNLQELPTEALQPLITELAKRLGPKAIEAPLLARQLVAAANRLDTGKIGMSTIDRRLQNLSSAVDDTVLDLVTSLSGSDALRTSIARLRDIPSASQDVRTSEGSSFLESVLAQPLPPEAITRVADFVDELGLQIKDLNPTRLKNALGGLIPIFGSAKNARTVVEYYGNLKREAYSREAASNKLVEDRPQPASNIIDMGEDDQLTEITPGRLRAQYRSPTPARPYFLDTDQEAIKAAEGTGARFMNLREYTATTDESPQFVAARVRSDLKERLRNAENRDTETVAKALADLDAVPEELRDENYTALRESLASRKTEPVQALPNLRKQMAAIEEASGVSFAEIRGLSRQITAAEKVGDSARAAELKNQLKKLEDTYSANAEKVLERMAVGVSEETDAVTGGQDQGASDETVAKFRSLLDRKKAPPKRANGESTAAFVARRDAAERDNADRLKTRIGFRMKGRSQPMYLSAESMVLNSKARGTPAQRLAESINDVLMRADVEGLVEPDAGTIVMRRGEGAAPLTWRDVNPGKPISTLSPAQRSKKQWADKQRKLEDADTAVKLQEYIEANSPALEDLVAMSAKLSARENPTFRDKSRLRVLDDYIYTKMLPDAFPVPSKSSIEDEIASAEEEANIYAPENNVAVDIAYAEATLEVLSDRLKAVKESPSLAKRLSDQIRRAEETADKMAGAAPLESRERYVPGKRSAMDPGASQQKPMDQAAIEAEILRIRGPEVQVAFDTWANIKGSGSYTISKDKQARLIRIAVNAANPMGVAWHEALHDFFAMLDENPKERAIKKDLIDASNAFFVNQKLNELLKDHPEALKQLRNSPEERVAYMYQFWAEGVLPIGPTGTGIFTRLQKFFRDMLGIVSAEARAADLLTALHKGEFTSVSAVAQTMDKLRADRLGNKLRKAAPALTSVLSKVVDAAPDRLREYQNDKLNELADMFSSERGKLGFIQRRFQQSGVWENKLAAVLEGTTVAERRAALENMQAMRPAAAGSLESKLAGFFSDIHEYMTGAGVGTYNATLNRWEPIRHVKDYFPRAWDRHAILRDPQGFSNLLKTHGKLNPTEIDAVIKALTRGTGQIELAENNHALGFTPFASAVKDRKFSFITPANATEFAKYQVKDLPDILTGYVKQVVHRAEYARNFGNDGEVITKMIADAGISSTKELADIGNIVQGLEGSLGAGALSPTVSEAMSGVMLLQNAVLLPLAIFSQAIDPVVLAARSGDIKDAGNAFVTAIKRLGGNKAEREDLADILGITSQDSVLDAMGAAYGSMQMSTRVRKLSQMFFKYNGMQGWNNSMRIAATAAGEKYLIANKRNTTVLDELGLVPADIQVIPGPSGDRLDVTSPQIKEALYRFVDSAVIRPSASNRPVWMSDPRFQLVAHLKQFTFAMHNVVLKRAGQELNEGNMRPWAILALAMPVILASDMLKFALTGGAPPNWGFMDYMTHAVSRSGLLGLGDFQVQAMKGIEHGGAPGEALLGPTFEHLMELLRWLGNSPAVDLDDVTDRTIPGARYL